MFLVIAGNQEHVRPISRIKMGRVVQFSEIAGDEYGSSRGDLLLNQENGIALPEQVEAKSELREYFAAEIIEIIIRNQAFMSGQQFQIHVEQGGMAACQSFDGNAEGFLEAGEMGKRVVVVARFNFGQDISQKNHAPHI
ncbi:hypothetical protein D3C71_1442880 [compost metagenome]